MEKENLEKFGQLGNSYTAWRFKSCCCLVMVHCCSGGVLGLKCKNTTEPEGWLKTERWGEVQHA